MSEPDTATATAPSSNLKGTKVSQLPLHSGGKSGINKNYHEMNTKMTLLRARTIADGQFDPNKDPYKSKPIVLYDGKPKTEAVEGFCSNYPIPMTLAVVGTLFFVYGLVAK